MNPEQLTQERQKYGIPATGLAQPAASSDRTSELDAAWKPTVPPTPSDTNAESATFPATGKEGPLGIAAKTVGNIPKSAVGFGKSVIDFLNPLNAVKHVQDLETGLKDNTGKANNPSEYTPSPSDVVKEIPGTAYKALVPQFLQHIFSGDLTKAAQTIENDPVGQIAPLLMLAKSTAEAAGKGEEFNTAMSKIATPATKPATVIGSGAAEVGKGSARFLAGQLTGLSPDTIQKIIADPHQFSKEAESAITRPALGAAITKAIDTRQKALDETGQEYSGVRTATGPIEVSPDYLDKLVSDTTGLDIKDGKLQTTGAASIRLPADVNALQSKLYKTWAPEFAKGHLTPNEFLNFRSDLSKLAFNDSGIGKSDALSNLSEVMRAKANQDLRPQVPGLENIDAHFAPQITELKQLSKGLVDKNGQLTDSAINRIANATGKGKDPVLARLEQLSPGITDHIKILKAVEDIQNSREVKVGTYLRAGALGAGIFSLNPYLIVSAIASIPQVAVPLLQGLGYSKAKIASITKTLGIPENAAAAANVAKASINAAPGATAQKQLPQPTQETPAPASSSMNIATPPPSAQAAALPTTLPQPETKPLLTSEDNGVISVQRPGDKPPGTIDTSAGMGAGSLERVGAERLAQIASKIHPEDIGIMRDVTDYAAQSFKPEAKQANELELAARRIWERYIKNIVPPKTIKGIANDFGRLLDHVKQP